MSNLEKTIVGKEENKETNLDEVVVEDEDSANDLKKEKENALKRKVLREELEAAGKKALADGIKAFDAQMEEYHEFLATKSVPKECNIFLAKSILAALGQYRLSYNSKKLPTPSLFSEIAGKLLSHSMEKIDNIRNENMPTKYAFINGLLPMLACGCTSLAVYGGSSFGSIPVASGLGIIAGVVTQIGVKCHKKQKLEKAIKAERMTPMMESADFPALMKNSFMDGQKLRRLYDVAGNEEAVKQWQKEIFEEWSMAGHEIDGDIDDEENDLE